MLGCGLGTTLIIGVPVWIANIYYLFRKPLF